MQLSDLQNLSEKELDEYYADQREKILARGSDAKTTWLYIEHWIESAKKECHDAFEKMPLDSQLKDYQLVKYVLDAVYKLEHSLRQDILLQEKLLGGDAEDNIKPSLVNI